MCFILFCYGIETLTDFRDVAQVGRGVWGLARKRKAEVLLRAF